MVNPNHVKLLQEGTIHWNDWRERQPVCQEKKRPEPPHVTSANIMETMTPLDRSERIDLDEANLDRLHLSGVNLSDVSLRRASLRETYLANADLKGARLIEANLRKAT